MPVETQPGLCVIPDLKEAGLCMPELQAGRNPCPLPCPPDLSPPLPLAARPGWQRLTVNGPRDGAQVSGVSGSCVKHVRVFFSFFLWFALFYDSH